jgi:hypothetical protein
MEYGIVEPQSDHSRTKIYLVLCHEFQRFRPK